MLAPKDFLKGGKRAHLSILKFKKVYDSFDDYKDAETFRKSLAHEILEGKLLSHHIKFLRLIGFYVLNVDGMDKKYLTKLSHVGENYFSTSKTYGWKRANMHQKYHYHYWKDKAKIMEETYFKFSDDKVLSTIIFGFGTDEKLMFRGKKSATAFLIEISLLIKLTGIMTYEQLAERLIRHTNIQRTEGGIVDFLNRQRA